MKLHFYRHASGCREAPFHSHECLYRRRPPVIRRNVAAAIRLEADLAVCGATASFEEAQRTLPEAHPDLVLLDLSLGTGAPSGLVLLRHLRERMAGTSWLVVSAHDAPATIRQVFEAGAHGFLSKRDMARHLLGAVRSVLAGERFGGA